MPKDIKDDGLTASVIFEQSLGGALAQPLQSV